LVGCVVGEFHRHAKGEIILGAHLPQEFKGIDPGNRLEGPDGRKKGGLGGRTGGMLEAEYGSVANHGELRLGRDGLETPFTRKNPWTIKKKKRKISVTPTQVGAQTFSS
jgi:hypothetical protein